MKWWQKLLLGLIRVLQFLTFRCKSDCCSCESECLQEGKDQSEKEEEEKGEMMETDIGTTYAGVKEDSVIFDYAHKITKSD